MQLATYLERFDISKSAFAARIGVTQVAVSRYVSGQRIPRPRLMEKIKSETGGRVTANDFFATAKQTEAA
jgi:predicted transcriptional regulator